MKKRERKPEEIARRAFRRALGDLKPDTGALAGAVPAMVAEARRRRAAEARLDPLSALVPVALRLIPRLAATAALLLLLATLAGLGETSETESTTTDLDRLILTGEVGDDGSDLLLDAMAGTGGGRG